MALRSLVLATTLAAAGLAAPPPAAPAFATWDRLYLNPQLPLTPIAPTGEVTLLLYHNYPDALHRLRLDPTGPAFQPVGAVPEVAELIPTVIHPVTLRLRRAADLTGDTATLTVTFSAAEVARPHRIELTVPLTPAGAAKLNAALAIPVGGVSVFVTRLGGYALLLQIALTVGLLAWVILRKLRMRHPLGRPFTA